jgi:hypothetical protein
MKYFILTSQVNGPDTDYEISHIGCESDSGKFIVEDGDEFESIEEAKSLFDDCIFLQVELRDGIPVVIE